MRTPRLVLSNSLLLLCIALLIPVSAFAQTGAASLTGIISDQSGAKVPGTTVTATNQATNVTYTAVSNEAGNYSITSVPVGSYVLKAELSGFKTATTNTIQVEAKATVRLDFDLQLGAIEETVLVAGQSPLLQTESVTVWKYFALSAALTWLIATPAPGAGYGYEPGTRSAGAC